MRQTLVAANWKMNGSIASNSDLLKTVKESVNSVAKVVIFPPAIYVPQVQSLLDGSPVRYGLQNIYFEASGAYTGELSLAMATDFGCQYVLVGHSERRALFAETDALIADKVAASLAAELTPILCVGESLAEREAGVTEKVVQTQIDAVLARVGIAAFGNIVIAYEPVWAIGTGKTASPEQAQAVHAFIRGHLAQQDADIAAETAILYGGSVKAANASELFAQPDIDGGLVGGASLKATEFVAICNAAKG